MRIEGCPNLHSEGQPLWNLELNVRVETGDSGAGVVDERGRLVGVVYGRTKALSNRSFAVGGQELADILTGKPDAQFICDPTLHRVVPVE